MGIVGLGKAIVLAAEEMDEENRRVRALRDRLWEGMRDRVDDIQLNGHPENRLPGTLNVSFKYIEGESILFRLESLGIAVSTGSACSSGSLETSYVLSSMGLPPEMSHGSIRFSLGRENSDDDIDYILEHLPGVIRSLREMSPLYQNTGS
jgi:cysteine desulfurase